MRYRAASIALLLLCLNFLWGIPAVDHALFALIGLWAVVSLRGMTSMRSQVFGRVYWRGDPGAQAVALSFDDGPGPATAKILDVLAAHGVKATFFVIGENLRRFPDIARRIHSEGHELANHTGSHPWVFRMLFPRIREEVEQCQAAVQEVAGYRPRFFRQPVGLNNPSVMKVLDEMGMVMVGWQARALDGFRTTREKVAARVLAKARPGGIILLHDGCDRRTGCDRSPTAEALDDIITGLKSRGYEFRTVGALIGVENRQGR